MLVLFHFCFAWDLAGYINRFIWAFKWITSQGIESALFVMFVTIWRGIQWDLFSESLAIGRGAPLRVWHVTFRPGLSDAHSSTWRGSHHPPPPLQQLLHLKQFTLRFKIHPRETCCYSRMLSWPFWLACQLSNCCSQASENREKKPTQLMIPFTFIRLYSGRKCVWIDKVFTFTCFFSRNTVKL